MLLASTKHIRFIASLYNPCVDAGAFSYTLANTISETLSALR